MKKRTAYLSHAIQGRLGNKATDAYMETNCKRVIQFTKKLRKEFGNQLDIYLPADHEEFVHRSFSMGLLSIDEILVIDCDIIKSKDILILYIPDSYVSGGMIKEAHKAKCLGKPVIQVNNRNWKQEITSFLKGIK